MADDSPRASSPEPGEAAPARGRIIQLKSSSSARCGSMDRQSLEAGRSPAYSSQNQQRRGGSPIRSYFPRPYSSNSGGGRGRFFKRQQMDYEGAGAAAPYQRNRSFYRFRGRSVSRSPSRPSQRTHSRSRSPKSPLRSRSRSRSRSFSPRGHRTFANWERSRRIVEPGQYVPGRGGRGSSFDGRQRGRERESWPRGGGRGGGRYANYQRGNRFYPKEVRYKSTEMLPHHRSMSRDRGSNDGRASLAGSFRDQQIRGRDRRLQEYEPEYCERSRDRKLSSRSMSHVRTSSFSPEYYRESEPSASAEEGEEKPMDRYVTTSERSMESRTPSESGSVDRDMNAIEGTTKRAPVASAHALPPRPSADGSRKERHLRVVDDCDGFGFQTKKKEVASGRSSRSLDCEKSDMEKAESTDSCAESIERETKSNVDVSETSSRCMSEKDLKKDQTHVKLTDKEPASAVEAQGADSTKATAPALEHVRRGGDLLMKEWKAPETSNHEDHDTRVEAKAISTSRPSIALEGLDKEEQLQKDQLMSLEKRDIVEGQVQDARKSLCSVSQQAVTSHDDKRAIDNKVHDSTASTPAASLVEDEKAKAQKHRDHKLPEDKLVSEESYGATKDDMADMDETSGSPSKVNDADQLSSNSHVASTADMETKSVDADDAFPSASAEQQTLVTDNSSTVSIMKPKEPVIPKTIEVKEREMVALSSDNISSKADASVVHDSLVDMRIPSSSLERRQGGGRALDAVKATALPGPGGELEKRTFVERSRTDPSAATSRDHNKPRSTSFSSPSLPIDSRRKDNTHEESKGICRAESAFTLRPAHEGKREAHIKQKNAPSSLIHEHSLKASERPVLDRRASLSMLSERSSNVPSGPRQGFGYSEASRSTSSFHHKSSSPKSHVVERNAEVRRKSLPDEVKKEDVVKRELLRTESVDSVVDTQLLLSGQRVQGDSEQLIDDKRGSKAREELPSLPDIPLPRGEIRGISSPKILGEGTPTKRHRPRLGWGQGLVAHSPPQPVKRPRIGWGQGLVQQNDDMPQNNTTTAPDRGNTCVSDDDARSRENNDSSRDENWPVKVEAGLTEAAISGDSYQKMDAVEESTLAKTASEKAKPVVIKDSSETMTCDAVNAGDKVTVEGGDIGDDNVTCVKPSKEEVLYTIDILDSDIAGIKKQIKALQRTVASAEVKQESTCAPVGTDLISADESPSTAISPTIESATTDIANEDLRDSPTKNLSSKPLLTSPVKLAVDSKFVEVLAGVFSENLRKSTAANDELLKRMENGKLATKVYHKPDDYPFYQENIDRGSVLSDQVRLKVRMRNRARHEYMKKLARDYMDLKKSWKMGVKKMEKDRKRMDKLRLKQLQKQKLKNMSESGPMRTSNTIHQSPHVQQLVAAEKAAEAAGESTSVRTSSRLTNNSSADLDNNDLEKIEQAKAQALVEQEVRKKRLKNALSTVIPDMLITAEDRQQRYFTRLVYGQSCMADGLITDWKLKEKAEMKVNPWNDLEKCIYMDKFLQFPKNFPRISSFLSNKTTGDVIAFYYRTKKVADYKALLREQQLRRRGAGSKNTWSCWNLSACAAICIGVQFPEHVTKLLLHPSNFRSHQASDNILNSATAQRLLRGSTAKREGNRKATASNVTSSDTVAIAESLSALDFVSGTDHPTSACSPAEAQLSNVINSGDSDTSDEEKFSLYTQQLEKFVAGQQRPFLVNYASLLTDNSYSTGYEVSTLSIEERLKKYPVPSKELESASNVTVGTGSANASQEATKGKHALTIGPHGNVKTCTAQMTKKEMKLQRKMKKTQDGACTPTTATTVSPSLQAVGGAGGEKVGSHDRKKNAANLSSTPGSSASNRGSPRILIPGEDKIAQNGKKSSRSGGSTPGIRRNSYLQANSTNASPKTSAATPAGASSMTAYAGGAMKKVSSGSSTPHANARTSSPSADTANSTNAAAPTKRVVQKWTEGEKADFLKFFSQHGKDWATLTENIPTKTAAQIKNYYQNYKNRLNLQDILKRRIENAAASGSGDNKGVSHSATASGNIAASPRSAAAGLMSGTLRQMGRSVELSGGLSMGMPSGSMAMNASDASLSFQAALSAAQPGMHGVNVLSELSVNQFGMQAHPDQQQQLQSREMINSASSSERYLKLLNMQHQLQLMQFQQQQKSQGIAAESGGTESNASFHENQVQTPNAQRLYQYSHQQQHQVPPQHLSVQAHQQMALQAHSQISTHGQMVPLPMQQQQQQQMRGSLVDMGHQSGLYQSMVHMQAQHSHAMAVDAQMTMSPASAPQYGRSGESGTGAVVEGGGGSARGNAGSLSGMTGCHDGAPRSMMNIAMMKNAVGGHNSVKLQHGASNSPRQPMASSRSMAMETSRSQEMERRQTTWHSAPASTPMSAASSAGTKVKDISATPVTYTTKDNPPEAREVVAPPVQPVRSRMSFSSILNESESPRDDITPVGNGSMVIRQQESSHAADQQRRQQQEQQLEQQQQMQQRQQPPLHLDHARAIPPSSAELARSPISAPSPTAHLLPRRSSMPTPHNRMGLMSSLLNVPSPERRTSMSGHQSPLMQQQQPMPRQTQSARYYSANASSTSSAGTASRGAMVPMSSTMTHVSKSEGMTSSTASMEMTVALSRSGSASSTSSVVSNAPPQGDPRAQQQMWNYAPQIRFEEAELLRRAQRAEEEAARAAAAAAAAARALQEAQQARQQALDMAANMARYNSAMQQQQQAQQQQAQQQQAQQQQAQQQQAQQQQAQQQQAQQQQAQQQQAQQQQAQQQQAQQQQAQQQQAQQHQAHQHQQYQQLQQYQLQAHHHQQMHQQQHEYQQQHQAQQLHQQQMQQHQALHHHLQLMQQQQQRSAVSSSDHLLQQQLHQQQQQQPPQRGPQSDR